MGEATPRRGETVSALSSLSQNLYKAVDVLHAMDPATLAALRSKYPLYKELLEPNLGPVQGSEGESLQRTLVVDTWVRALETAVGAGETLERDYHRSLVLARRVDIGFAIVTTANASALAALIVGDSDARAVQATLAIVTMVSSMSSIVTTALRSTSTNASKAAEVVSIRQHLGEARVVLMHLRSVSGGAVIREERMVERADTVLVSLHAMCAGWAR